MTALLIGVLLPFVPLFVPLLGGPAAATRGCRADVTAPRMVGIRVYSRSRLSEASLLALLDTANRVWRPYGVRIVPATDRDAVVVVVSDGTTQNMLIGPAVLGSTLFVEGHAMPNIALSLGAAEGLAATMDLTPSFDSRPAADRDAILLRMLGVALAHEMGHYLMDTARHSREGLLQSAISPHDLQAVELSHLGLTDEQRRLVCLGPPIRHDN
jgi:hypothetical protein